MRREQGAKVADAAVSHAAMATAQVAGITARNRGRGRPIHAVMPRRYHSVVLCGCPSNAMCDRCREQSFMQLKGTAACRGEAWADRVALEVARDRAWPSFVGRVAELARGKVADLSRDPQLRESLAMELWQWAARRWLQL
jgi:hypothetical protein